MDITTVLVLALSLITAMMLFGMIFYGFKNREQISAMQMNLDTSATNLEGSAREMLKALKDNRGQQERILNRLENLEAIVASEAWDAIQSGEDKKRIHLHLKDEEDKEPTAEEKAKIIAKRVR